MLNCKTNDVENYVSSEHVIWNSSYILQKIDKVLRFHKHGTKTKIRWGSVKLELLIQKLRTRKTLIFNLLLWNH